MGSQLIMSGVLIDTHILIWDQLDPNQLTSKAKKAIAQADADNQIHISEISLWEIAILLQKKRLQTKLLYLDFIQKILRTHQFILQGINPDIAYLASTIELETKDPTDRLIAATSIHLGIPLITSDKLIINAKDVNTIWK